MVNSRLETSVRDVYAAGDCCTAAWVPPKGWFQVRKGFQWGSVIGMFSV